MNTKLYISYNRKSQDLAEVLYDEIKYRTNLKPWMHSRSVSIGQDWRSAERNSISQSDIFILFIDELTYQNENQLSEISKILELTRNSKKEKFVIPIMKNYDLAREPVTDYLGITIGDKNEEHWISETINGLENISSRIDDEIVFQPKVEILDNKQIQITALKLINVRCFNILELNLENDSQWTMILGDNASGKSTILKSIAIGLCNESEAINLLVNEGGKLIRNGEDTASIKIELIDRNNNTGFTIITDLKKDLKTSEEVIRKTISDPNYSYDDIFLCGYGTNRTKQAYTGFENYSKMEAVKTLFNVDSGLQNPELILLRTENKLRNKIEKTLLKIMQLDTTDSKFNYTKSGVEITGPWGKVIHSALSDGYRTTSHWIIDFIGWIIYSNRIFQFPNMSGILIIDELELQLHPQWQKFIIKSIREQFPRIQIISTTHTPLIASGIADIPNSHLIRLKLEVSGEIEKYIIKSESLDGLNANQVLTTIAFGLDNTHNPGTDNAAERYTSLLEKKDLTIEEKQELNNLKIKFREINTIDDNFIGREIEKEIRDNLEARISNYNPEQIDSKIKQKLKEMFNKKNNEKN